MFSTTTIPLSTNIPKARMSEKSTIKFKEMPRASRIRKEINMDKGMADPTKRAFRKPIKNINTKTTRMIPKIMEFSKSLTWVLVCLLWSFVIEISTFSGNRLALVVSMISLILSAASSKFSPLRLVTLRVITGRFLLRAYEVLSLKVSLISATSFKYTIFCWSVLTIISSKSCGLVNSPSTRSVRSKSPFLILPPEAVKFSLWMAPEISPKLTPMDSIL